MGKLEDELFKVLYYGMDGDTVQCEVTARAVTKICENYAVNLARDAFYAGTEVTIKDSRRQKFNEFLTNRGLNKGQNSPNSDKSNFLKTEQKSD